MAPALAESLTPAPVDATPAPAESATPAPAESSEDHSASVYQVRPPSQPTYDEPAPVQDTETPTKSEAALGGGLILFAIIVGCAVAILLYFAPTFVAYRRHHKDKLAIFVFNIFFGWFAWIWALTGNVEKNDVIQVNVNLNDPQLRRGRHTLIDGDGPMPPRRGGFITGGDE